MKSRTKRHRHLYPGMIFRNLSCARALHPSVVYNESPRSYLTVAAHINELFAESDSEKIHSTLEITMCICAWRSGYRRFDRRFFHGREIRNPEKEPNEVLYFEIVNRIMQSGFLHQWFWNVTLFGDNRIYMFTVICQDFPKENPKNRLGTSESTRKNFGRVRNIFHIFSQ